jgi:Tol biopolymer transport system component
VRIAADADAANSPVSWGGITLSTDGLEAYVTGSDGTFGSPSYLYRVTRQTETEEFGDPEPVLNGKGSELEAMDPALSPDGLSLYYVVKNDLGSKDTGNIYLTKRRSLSERFTAGVPVTVVNSPYLEADPYVSRDGTVLYFDTNRDGDLNIYRAQIGGSEYPVPEASVDWSSNSEQAPVLTADELTIFFASNRNTLSRSNIWMATRTTTTDGFGDATQIEKLTTTAYDYPDAVSDDGCTLWFSVDALGTGHFASATRGDP